MSREEELAQEMFGVTPDELTHDQGIELLARLHLERSFGERLMDVIHGLTIDSDLSTCKTCGSDLYRTNMDGRWHHPGKADHAPAPMEQLR